MRKKIRSIHIILFVLLFLVGSFIDISTIHAEAGSRTGSIQIIYKGRNSSDKEVTLSGAEFSIFPIQYMKNDELVAVLMSGLLNMKASTLPSSLVFTI